MDSENLWRHSGCFRLNIFANSKGALGMRTTEMHSCSMNKLTLNKTAKMTLTLTKIDVTGCTGPKTTCVSLIHGGSIF